MGSVEPVATPNIFSVNRVIVILTIISIIPDVCKPLGDRGLSKFPIPQVPKLF